MKLKSRNSEKFALRIFEKGEKKKKVTQREAKFPQTLGPARKNEKKSKLSIRYSHHHPGSHLCFHSAISTLAFADLPLISETSAIVEC